MVDRLVVVDCIVLDSVVDGCWLKVDSVVNGSWLMVDSVVDGSWLMVDSVVDGSWLMVDSVMSSVVKTSMVGSGQSNFQKYEGHETLHLECS